MLDSFADLAALAPAQRRPPAPPHYQGRRTTSAAAMWRKQTIIPSSSVRNDPNHYCRHTWPKRLPRVGAEPRRAEGSPSPSESSESDCSEDEDEDADEETLASWSPGPALCVPEGSGLAAAGFLPGANLSVPRGLEGLAAPEASAGSRG